MIKFTKNISLIFFIITLSSCLNKNGKNDNNKKSFNQEEIQIYGLFIDKLTLPYPVPPPPGLMESEEFDQEKNKKFWDSIGNIPTTVIIDTTDLIRNQSITLPNKFEKYKDLVDKLTNQKLKRIHNHETLKSSEGHTFVYGNSLIDGNLKHPQLFSFSKIAFDKSKTHAALYVRHKTHDLSSFFNLYLLAKRNGIWEIIYEKNLEFS